MAPAPAPDPAPPPSPREKGPPPARRGSQAPTEGTPGEPREPRGYAQKYGELVAGGGVASHSSASRIHHCTSAAAKRELVMLSISLIKIGGRTS